VEGGSLIAKLLTLRMSSLEIEKDDNSEDVGGATYVGAAINLAKLCIGTGILALPFATLKGGLLMTPVGIFFIAGWNWLGCRQMIECKYASMHKTAPEGLSSTFSRIAFCAGGWPSVYLTDASIIITLLGVCVAYQITFGRLLEGFFEAHSMEWVTASELSFVTLVMLAVPVLMMTDVSSLTQFSVAGLVMLLVGVAAIILFGIGDYGAAALSPSTHPVTLQSLHLWPGSLNDYSTFIGIATFSFGMSSLVFPIEESMKFRSEFNRAAVLALSFVWLVYSFMGIGVSLLFVHDPKGIASNILENLPQRSIAADVVRVSFAIVCLLTFPLAFIPPVAMMESYLLRAIDSLPSSAGADGAPQQSLLQRWAFDYESINDSYAHDGTSAANPGSDRELRNRAESLDIMRRASPLLRSLTRLSLLSLTTAIASEFPCFGMIVSLLGCFTVSILSFVLPPFFRLKLVSMPGFENTGDYTGLLSDVFLTGAGVLLCVTSSYVVSRQILEGGGNC